MFSANTRILIVDDMASLRDLLKAYLRRLGFKHITEAVDGRDAYQTLIASKAAGNSFELIISDWNMPNMTGLELLKLVRSVPEWKNLPFLILTTENEKEKVMEAVVAGASNYIVKPVEEKVLQDKLLRTWLKISQSS
ncbi:MAG: response regulator [Bdellovibrionaceae bacterium]|nr:response regulator [Pseudobdellovibrionaceae bacterium]